MASRARRDPEPYQGPAAAYGGALRAALTRLRISTRGQVLVRPRESAEPLPIIQDDFHQPDDRGFAHFQSNPINLPDRDPLIFQQIARLITLSSDWVVQMQRMLSDALRVLRDLAREAPDDAATILKSWKLDNRLSAFESAIKHELVALVGLLMHRQDHRGYLESLLHRLAESGHGPALALIAELAQKLRKA